MILWGLTILFFVILIALMVAPRDLKATKVIEREHTIARFSWDFSKIILGDIELEGLMCVPNNVGLNDAIMTPLLKEAVFLHRCWSTLRRHSAVEFDDEYLLLIHPIRTRIIVTTLRFVDELEQHVLHPDAKDRTIYVIAREYDGARVVGRWLEGKIVLEDNVI